jgi:hypothetical protein
MNSSLRSFRRGLYEEHMEEIGFLYEQSLALRDVRTQPWTAPADFESRREAHLDALLIGNELALEVCMSRADSPDAGEIYGALSLICRRAEPALLKGMLGGQLLERPKQRQALGNALAAELPAAWEPGCMRALAEGDSRLAPVLSVVAGQRRLDTGGALGRALRRAATPDSPALWWAAGRCKEPLRAQAAAAYEDSDLAVQAAARRAGLRLQDPAAAQFAINGDDHVIAALAGGRDVASRILHRLQGAVDVAALPPAVPIALGLLGDLTAVRPLVGLLETESLAGLSAEALHLITGAPLYEQVLTPEPVAEDELFEAELKRWRERGDAPRRADGQPFGERVQRVSRDPAAWGAWLLDHGNRFNTSKRYRLGLPCTPSAMLRSLTVGLPTRPWRELLIEELMIRHHIDPGIDVDMPISMQCHRLASALARGPDAGVQPGAWYLAGAAL